MRKWETSSLCISGSEFCTINRSDGEKKVELGIWDKQISKSVINVCRLVLCYVDVSNVCFGVGRK